MTMKIYMISITGHPVSAMYKREVMSSWKEAGYTVHHKEAVTPKDLNYKNKLDFGYKKTKLAREFTETEKAVWYSHFELWCESVRKQEKILIIEHDSKLVKPLPDLSSHGYRFLSFLNREKGLSGRTGIDIAPGSGYYLTPIRAQQLVSKAVSVTIKENSDGFIANALRNGWKKQRDLEPDSYRYIEQINIDGLNTIDHKTPHRQFIGPDYENFDISSVHRKA